MRINLEIPIHPHKDSDAAIGLYIRAHRKPHIVYGRFYGGIYFGRYLISYDGIYGFSFCNYFATGTGG